MKRKFLIKIKKEGFLYDYIYSSHPFDVVGWDGYNYPYAFSIHDFEPIAQYIAAVHQTFETPAFVIVHFVQDYMITILTLFRHLTTTVILILTKCYTM